MDDCIQEVMVRCMHVLSITAGFVSAEVFMAQSTP